MASAQVKLVMDNKVLDGLLRGEGGPVYTDLMRRATILQKAATMQIALGTSGDSGPGGHLKYTVVKRIQPNSSGKVLMAVWVGSNHPRAMMYHEGTSAHVINARGDKPLHFQLDGMDVYAMSVQHPGTAPNKYLTDNIQLVAQ
jgi:hypothetical protein